MNRLLIGILDILNKLLAIVLIVSSTISGYYGEFDGYVVAIADPLHRVFATLIGFVVGIVAAALVSGLLAAIITIARETMTIHALLLERTLATR